MATKTAVIRDETPVQLPTGLPFVKGETNRRLIRAALKAAGVEPHYPITTPETLSLVGVIGYRADTAVLSNGVRGGCFRRPQRAGAGGKAGGRAFLWTEADIVNFADYLESLRRWLPLHEAHKHKMNPKEIAEGVKEIAAKKATFEALAQMHPAELINLLVGEGDQQKRAELAFALKTKLGLIHLRGNESVSQHETQDN